MAIELACLPLVQGHDQNVAVKQLAAHLGEHGDQVLILVLTTVRADQVASGNHIPILLVETGVVRGVEDHGFLHTLPDEVGPRPMAPHTLVWLLRVESPWTVVQEEVETLATLAFVVVEAT